MSSTHEIFLQDGFLIIKLQNFTKEAFTYQRASESNLIQFHFALRGNSTLTFNQGNYQLKVSESKSFLLYNPQTALPLNITLEPDAQFVSVLIPIQKLHRLFSEQADYIPFLSKNNELKKFYKEEILSIPIILTLNQIFQVDFSNQYKKLYLKGKIYELLSLYFDDNENNNAEQCPFLADEENVHKIRKAKDIIIANMSEPPSLQELADSVGITLKKLKLGFKQIYGDSVYGFLLDYKLHYAQKLLDSGSYNVNEVGLKIGYSTSSHFIAAFKKKFGITPKKYLLSIHPTLN
ncbi:MAG: AraC family transcriptional regulator [Bacteroidota bacterium]|nr:AraC family transcriptional regulator [Bacteroidota bacterium]